MLAKLCMTTRDERATTSIDPTIRSMDEMLTADPTLESLSEEEWINLVLWCDTASADLTSIYKAATALATRHAKDDLTAAQLNAYYFLRSQNKTIPLILMNGHIAQNILDSDDIAAWAILLSEENCPTLSNVLPERIAYLFPKIITWMKANISDRQAQQKMIAYYHDLNLENPGILLSLMSCAVKDKTSLYNPARTLMLNQDAVTEDRLTAYCFLRSENQTIDYLFSASRIHVAILESDNTEAWARLLTDKSCPKDILSMIALEESQNQLSLIVEWVTANNKDRIEQVLSHFVALQNSVVVMNLVLLGLQGKCKLHILRSALTASIVMKDDPLFNIVFLQKNLTANPEDTQAIILALEGIEATRREFPKKVNELFNVFIVPGLKAFPQHLNFTARIIFVQYPDLLGDFVKLTSNMSLDTDTIHFLAEATLKIAHDWKIVRSEEESKKIHEIVEIYRKRYKDDFGPEYTAKFESFLTTHPDMSHDEAKHDFLENVLIAERLASIEKDMNAGQARIMQQMLIDLLTSKDVWDTVIKKQSFDFPNDLQRIIEYSTVELFNLIFRSLWDQTTGERKCSITAINWLFEQPKFSDYSFIDFFYDASHQLGISVNAKSRLQDIFRFNDREAIHKLFEMNARLSDRIDYPYTVSVTSEEQAAIDEKFKTSVITPHPELNKALQNQPPRYPLFLALTIISDYSGLENAVVPLLQDSSFHIADYYPNASAAFKQLPAVKAAMQLQYFFYPETIPTPVDPGIADITIVHDSAIFFHYLKTYYIYDLTVMTRKLYGAHSSSKGSAKENEELYNNAKSLHKQIKKIPKENRIELNQDIGFATYSLAYRILANEAINTPDTPSARAKYLGTRLTAAASGYTLIGKEIKTPFLRYILTHLITHQACSPANTGYSEAPFIWGAYVEYIKNKRAEQKKQVSSDDTQYSLEKISKINEWLQRILDGTVTQKTKETLALLPENLLQAIFGFEGSTVDLNNLRDIRLALLDAPDTADIKTADGTDNNALSHTKEGLYAPDSEDTFSASEKLVGSTGSSNAFSPLHLSSASMFSNTSSHASLSPGTTHTQFIAELTKFQDHYGSSRNQGHEAAMNFLGGNKKTTTGLSRSKAKYNVATGLLKALTTNSGAEISTVFSQLLTENGLDSAVFFTRKSRNYLSLGLETLLTGQASTLSHDHALITPGKTTAI